MADVFERVIELFDSTCDKQFESMQCDIHSLDSASFELNDDSVCADINCYSDDLRLDFSIIASKGFLMKTNPLIESFDLGSISFQKDWCLELANRFLGRLKNKLLDHGCSLKMGLPVLIECSSDQEGVSTEDNSVSRVFQTENNAGCHQVKCTLKVQQLNPQLELLDYEDEDEDWFDESELQHL
tara:strand:+ start:3617 stop:4168 length:552 start_codon:yes stop_codon:yes gene_type:complete